MYKWLAVGHKTRTLPALHTDWQYLGLWPMPNMAGMQLARPGPTRLGTKRNGVALFDARSVAHMPAITFTNLYILCLLWHCQWQDRRSQQLYWLAPARLPRHTTPHHATPHLAAQLPASIMCLGSAPPPHPHSKWRAFAKNACWSHHHRSSKSGAAATPNSFKYPLNLKSMLAHYASDNAKSQSQTAKPGTHNAHNIRHIFMSPIHFVQIQYNIMYSYYYGIQ